MIRESKLIWANRCGGYVRSRFSGQRHEGHTVPGAPPATPASAAPKSAPDADAAASASAAPAGAGQQDKAATDKS